MRIQHNIMAMNAYRNYTNNVSAMKSNLEKLSSGYKINRAGDDAAGLAISEKMRAQITGLQTAQKNAKDGISLVQTAEGALTEVHDMLNRMVELATQSANGTYDNETDRYQLQKEMNQLKSEINRIADSANFNGIKLLDGSMDSGEAQFANVKGMTLRGVGTNGEVISNLNIATGSAGGIILHEDAAKASKTSFTIDLQGFTANDTGTYGLSSLQTFTLHSAAGSQGSGVQVAQITYNIGEGRTSLTGEDIAKAIANKGTIQITMAITSAATAAPNATTDVVTITYDVKLGADGKSLVFTMTDEGFAAASAADKTAGSGNKNDAFQGNFNFGVTVSQKNAAGVEDASITGYQDTATKDIHVGHNDAGAIRAEAAMDFKDISISDGAGIKIGDQYYVWGTSDKTVNTDWGENVHVVDIRDLCKDGIFEKNPQDTTFNKMTEALSRLTAAAADNSMFDVQLARGGNILVFNENVGNTDTENLKTLEGLKKELQTFTATSFATTGGKSLTLQIGDTAEDFNQLKVNIKDCHTSALGLDGVKISDQASAQNAIDAIKSAINYVSDVRGTLGATQNRLDHTINNLSVMTENIQDAESTIRDTDVAEEMMAYTKNNILIQSAQAMLAQANQVPQGVLQLLG